MVQRLRCGRQLALSQIVDADDLVDPANECRDLDIHAGYVLPPAAETLARHGRVLNRFITRKDLTVLIQTEAERRRCEAVGLPHGCAFSCVALRCIIMKRRRR